MSSWVWKADEGAMPKVPPRAPLDSSRRAAFRPLFLLIDESGEAPMEIVTISSPRREEGEDGSFRLVARPTEKVAVLADIVALDCAAAGQTVHVVPDRVGWSYRRLSTDEAERLRKLDAERRTSRQWSEARWASYLAKIPEAAELERQRRLGLSGEGSSNGQTSQYQDWCSGDALSLLAEHAPELAMTIKQALEDGRLSSPQAATASSSVASARELA